MDRRRAHRVLIAGIPILGAALAAAAALAAEAPVRALQWVAPGRDAVRALTVEPAECLAKPTTAEAAYAVEVGRAAFRHPLLLGNQGARAGLTCESCHRNGHDNPDFAFPGLSGGPGTADVTSSVTSEHRGDGVFNPKPIPTLTARPGALKVSRDPARPDLRNFIHGLVTEEFDGPEPPPAVMNGLAAYVRALSPTVCPRRTSQRVTVAGRMSDVRRALKSAEAALARRDTATARVMVAAARSELGSIAERFEAPALKTDLAAIQAASVDLGRLQNDLGGRGGSRALAAWSARLDALEARLRRREAQSLFDPRRLAASLAGG